MGDNKIKPVSRRQLLYVFPHLWLLGFIKVHKIIRQESIKKTVWRQRELSGGEGKTRKAGWGVSSTFNRYLYKNLKGNTTVNGGEG